MDLAATLDHLTDRFAAGDDDAGQELLGQLFRTANSSDDAAAAVMAGVVSRLPHAAPLAGAWLALLGGALVEDGAPVDEFARALREPLKAALFLAAPFMARIDSVAGAAAVLQNAVAADLGAGSDGADDADGAGADDAGADDGADAVGDELDDLTGRLPREVLLGLAEEDPDGHAALVSLDTWYRPVVAGWTRHEAALREAQADVVLMERLAALDGAVLGTTWLNTLCHALSDAPLVLLFPELREAWTLRASGVVDVSQLSLLLADALREPLGRMGFSEPVDAALLAVARGDLPSRNVSAAMGVYSCGFHLYPWQASDVDGAPRAGVFSWRAPGGTGTHSLPLDFRPGEIAPLGGVRVLLVSGKSGPLPFARMLSAGRAFEALPARIDRVKRLPDDEAAAWRALVARAVRAQSSSAPAGAT